MEPEDEALLADSVGLALLVVLDALPPAERLAFVLHDMFAAPFDQSGPTDVLPDVRGPAMRSSSRRRSTRPREETDERPSGHR